MPSKKFYDIVRDELFDDHLKQSQVDGIEAIVASWGEADQRYIAYALATVYWECSRTMQPIEESGKGHGYDYGKKLKRGGGKGKRIPYEQPDKIYYGRGYVQLTWYENYAVFSHLLGIDLLNHPEYALQADVASKILLRGMTHGDFTGHALREYFNDTTTDWVNARKIINGLDQASKIGFYAKIFYKALQA